MLYDQEDTSEEFAALQQMPDGERELRLRAIENGDPSHADDLRSLLKAGQNVGDKFNDAPPLLQRFAEEDDQPLFSPGDVIFESVEILEFLGKGTFGEVYKINYGKLDRAEAMKVLLPYLGGSEKQVTRFMSEAGFLSALSDPRIPVIHDVGFHTDRSLYWLRMEYVDGETLRNKLTQPLGWRSAVEIAFHVAGALHSAHEENVTHRDIKPENIMITRSGGVKVLDFGIAKLQGPDKAGTRPIALTQAGSRIGTQSYMSPEQWTVPESVDHRTDIWSLGVVLLEMVLGRTPKGDELLNVPKLQLPTGTPESVTQVIEKSLKFDRDSRFQSAKQFEDALQDLLSKSGNVWPIPEKEKTLILFTPTAIKALPVDASKIRPFWPIDLGKAWALDRGSFVGLAFNPHGVDIGGEFRGIEAMLHDAAAEIGSRTLPRRIWLRVRTDILTGTNTEIRHLDDLLLEDDRGLVASLAGDFSHTCIGLILTIDNAVRPSSMAPILGKLCGFVFAFCFSRGWQLAIAIDLRLQNKEARRLVHSVLTDSVALLKRDDGTAPRIETFLIDRYPSVGLDSVADGTNFFSWFRELGETVGYDTVLDRFRQAGALPADFEATVRHIMVHDPEAEIEHLGAAQSLKHFALLSDSQAVAIFLQLINDNLRHRLDEVVEAFAHSCVFDFSQQAIIVAAASDQLMDRWIAGSVAGGSDLDIKRVIAPRPGESLREPFVLACLRRYSTNQDTHLLNKWLSEAGPMERNLRDIVDHFLYPSDAADLRQNLDLADRWLYSRCGIDIDDLYGSINDQKIDKAYYWRCLSTNALDRRQVELFLGLASEKRAVWGLCTPAEWEKIRRDPNLKDQITDSRGLRPVTFLTEIEPTDSL